MLFESYKIGDLELKNRLVMAPMCMFCAPETGMVTDFHVTHYATRAIGGIGLITVEATAVSPEGRISANDLGLWSDEHIPGMKRIVDVIHANGAKAAIQIGHAGRKCSIKGIGIEAPSAIAFSPDYEVPKEMTKEDIKTTIEEFKQAAIRAEKAGFDMIQIHGAHGYLLNEFLSPITNQRTDEYGGSHENRVRFVGEVIEAVKSVWTKPIELRVTAEDYAEGGNLPEDLAIMINLIKDKGIDSVNVSTGGVLPAMPPKVFPGYQLPHAKVIKEKTGLPVCGGGLITDLDIAKAAVEKEGLDQVYLARLLLRNPYFALQAAKEEGIEGVIPKQYVRGF